MRILMYGWEFPPHISGGLGVACFGMTQALVEQGHQVTFVMPRLNEDMVGKKSHVTLMNINQFPQTAPDEDDPEWLAHTGSETLREALSRLRMRAVDSPLSPYLNETQYQELLTRVSEMRRKEALATGEAVSSSPIDANISGDYGPNLLEEIFRYAKAAGRMARATPHDVIHCHDWMTMLAGLEAKRVSKAPLVVHVHALEFDRSGDNVNPAIFEIERQGMTAADRVIAVSHYTKNRIVERYGIDPNKIDVVHNAVTRSRSPLHGPHRKFRKDKVVLFLGRITFQKGPDYFVEAAKKVLNVRQDVRFVVAGSGDMAPKIIERVAELGIGRRVHFTGFLSGEELERVFLESDIYVMPSVSEPFGISPLEAMCYDVPVIISNQSGVAEVLLHALKVDFWDVNDIADKILAMLEHDVLRQELLQQGAQELAGIQWSKAAASIVQIYESLQHREVAAAAWSPI